MSLIKKNNDVIKRGLIEAVALIKRDLEREEIARQEEEMRQIAAERERQRIARAKELSEEAITEKKKRAQALLADHPRLFMRLAEQELQIFQPIICRLSDDELLELHSLLVAKIFEKNWFALWFNAGADHFRKLHQEITSFLDDGILTLNQYPNIQAIKALADEKSFAGIQSDNYRRQKLIEMSERLNKMLK